MKKLLLFISFIPFFTFAQDLYMPLEYKKAYENNTRKKDGTVSDTYWQNRSRYDIKVTVNPETKNLKGESDIWYYNNSPDSLSEIVFHAYHNYYRPNSIKRGFFSSSSDNLVDEGMVLDLVVVDDTEIDVTDREAMPDQGTFYSIILSEKLSPSDSINLKINWHFEIAGEGFERSGAIEPNSMFIGYWYPEIAVYDDVFGWDQIVYDAATEFYHDKSDFKVEITVPDDFLVWASSEPVNADDIYPKDIQNRLKKARNSEDPVRIVTEKDIANGLKMKTNTWKYEAKGFPDFSFALSNRFNWNAVSYEDEFGKYFLHIAFDPNHPEFESVSRAQQNSLDVFHHQFPKYEFPFKYFTIFNGLNGGGMEFAGMANDESYSAEEYAAWLGPDITDFDINYGLTLHEMCHMYFPFMMGTNEKRFAWMDEGLADFAEYFIPSLFSGEWDKSYLGEQYVTPMMVPSYVAPDYSGINSYTIGSQAYYSLYHLLGDETFSKSMKAYMDRWKGKHPIPYDFFYTFNDTSGEDLNWFWNRWFFDWGYPDISISRVSDGKITLRNEGRKPLAVELSLIKEEDESMESVILSPEIWKDTDEHTLLLPDGDFTGYKITIIGGSDAVLENNYWPRRGN